MLVLHISWGFVIEPLYSFTWSSFKPYFLILRSFSKAVELNELSSNLKILWK